MDNCLSVFYRKTIRLFTLIPFFFLLFTLYSAGSVYADLSSQESFDGQITNPVLWDVSRVDGVSYPTLDGRQVAKFEYGTSHSFPYLGTFDLSYLNINHVNLRFNVSGVAPLNQGSGIIFSDTQIHTGLVPIYTDYLFFIWPKPDGSFHLFTPICPESDPSCNVSNQMSNGVFHIPSGEWHDLDIYYNSSKYEFYLNGEKVFETLSINRQINYLGIGHPYEPVTTSLWPYFYIDNIAMNLDDGNGIYYSQLDPEWSNQEYDSASEWAGEENSGIGRWGCALTSGAMIMKNYEVGMLQGETCVDTNPENLNQWLKDHEDGYVRNGLVNWLALSRFSRISYDDSCSDTKLEFSRNQYSPEEEYSTPNILGLEGHFVVGVEDQGSTYSVLDPADESATSIDESNILGVVNFTPSETDLSYIMAVADDELDASIEKGGLIQSSFKEAPIKDDVDNESDSGEALSLAYWQKPETGSYVVTVTNTGDAGTYLLEIYLYDEDGNPKIEAIEIELTTGETKQFLVEYDKDNVEEPDLLEMSFSEMVWRFFESGDISEFDIAKHLSSYSVVIEKFEEKSKVQELLETIIDKYISAYTPSIISERASDILIGYDF